jgi:pyruvate/2-oxoglutarate dehydrogenase complex dihydrolipoamide dehydrogenase (E3) component
MSDKNFDIVIIGGGAGGLFAASVAKALDAKVCIVEKKKLGGDCTWHGCMPSKATLKSAHVAHLIKRASDFGLKLQGGFNLETNKVMSHVRDVINEIACNETPGAFKQKGIDVIIGSARFIDVNTIEVDGKRIVSKKFIVCTGSHPMVPPIDGLKDLDYLTNENIFSLDVLPESLVVLGGGPIGVELSQALGRLGVKITIVEMMDRILFREEKELAEYVEKRFNEENIELLTGRKAVKFEKRDGRVFVTTEDKQGNKQEISAQQVLVAVGRAPNVNGLDLEKAGVEYTPKGIKVNDYLQTTSKNIFACGDIASPYQFSHVASYQGGVCVRNALFKKLAWQKVSYDNMIWATFTDPELAHLGLTEEEARKKLKDVDVYTTPYTNSDRSVTDLEKDGMLKVIIDKKGLILGAHIVGSHAGDLIHGFAIARAAKMPLDKIASTLFAYPTLSELIKKTAAKPLVKKVNNPLIKFILKVMKNI